MTDQDPQSQDFQDAASGLASPGELLRDARQQAGLSLEELAQRTRIAKATLDAMERDDFEALLEPVYVRGYYRKCAQVLEIDEAPLVEGYGRVYTPPPTPTPARLRLAPNSDFESPSKLPFKLSLVVPIILIVIVGAIWLVRKAPTSSSADQSITLIDPNNQGVVMSDALPPLDEDQETDDSDAVEENPGPAVDQADEPLAAEDATLELEFTALSWARIKDASGRSLLSGVISEGATRTLEGKPPFSVFLGNAPGVVVRFNGETIDTQPHTDTNAAARFTLPASGR